MLPANLGKPLASTTNPPAGIRFTTGRAYDCRRLKFEVTAGDANVRRGSNVVKESHKPEIHVQLLVAVK
jgi:hypothetical protein